MQHVIQTIGFGGGCHWCTEAYFQSLKGVEKVEQGWISSLPPDDTFSEAVLVHYNPAIIPLHILVAIHLHTHAATSQHSLRAKYRSAVYVCDRQLTAAAQLIAACQPGFDAPIITRALALQQFKPNTPQYRDYYQKNKEGVFCERYIYPKLQLMEKEWAVYFKKPGG